jgi:glycosyltransferase 2 family protein
MEAKPRRWWPVVKALLGLAILGAVGWRFGQDLGRPELYAQPVRWPWLVLAAGLYLVGMALSGLYWHRLLRHLGESPALSTSLRTYFIATLGKYVPGKAMAMVLRIGMMRAEGVPAFIAGKTTFCEVLTTMGSGAVLAAALFVFFGPVAPAANLWNTLSSLIRLEISPEHPVDRWALVVVCLGLSAVTLGPIFPPVVNFVYNKLAIRGMEPTVKRLRTAWLLEGLAQIMPAWVLMGVGVACAFQAIPGAELPWTLPVVGRLTAIMGLSYVAAFLLWTPGGLGVREFLLGLLLAPELAGRVDEEWVAGRVVLAVLLLRVAWTVAELLAAGALYWVPTTRAAGTDAASLQPSVPGK